MNAVEAQAKIEHQQLSRKQIWRQARRAYRINHCLNVAIRRNDWPRIRHWQELLADFYEVPRIELEKARR